MSRKLKLLGWEIACVFWVMFAGSVLHFAFELSDYWRPLAIMAAVNESAWEHVKMYFWPCLVWALVQFTCTREIANNFWLGKAAALVVTPVVIFSCYFGYMGYVVSSGGKATLWGMLLIMFMGVTAGQLTSWSILASRPLELSGRPLVPAIYALLVLAFSSFTYFPPRVFLFENFFCYRYTGEYGILSDYAPYRVFMRVDESGQQQQGGGVLYCDRVQGTASAAETA